MEPRHQHRRWEGEGPIRGSAVVEWWWRGRHRQRCLTPPILLLHRTIFRMSIITGIIRRDTPSITISIMPQRVAVVIRPLCIHLIVILTSNTSKKIRTMTIIMCHHLLPRLHTDTRPIHGSIPVDIPIIGPSIRHRPPIIIPCRHNDHPALDGRRTSTRSTCRLTPLTVGALQRRATIIIHQLIHNFPKLVVLPFRLGLTAGIHPLGTGPKRTTTH